MTLDAKPQTLGDRVTGWLNRPVPKKKDGRVIIPHTSGTNNADDYTHFRDRLPVSQVPQEQRFTTIFTMFWVSFGCFDLRFSEHHN